MKVLKLYNILDVKMYVWNEFQSVTKYFLNHIKSRIRDFKALYLRPDTTIRNCKKNKSSCYVIHLNQDIICMNYITRKLYFCINFVVWPWPISIYVDTVTQWQVHVFPLNILYPIARSVPINVIWSEPSVGEPD